MIVLTFSNLHFSSDWIATGAMVSVKVASRGLGLRPGTSCCLHPRHMPVSSPSRRWLQPLAATSGGEQPGPSPADHGALKERMERLAQSAADLAKTAADATAEASGTAAVGLPAADVPVPDAPDARAHHKQQGPSEELAAAKWDLVAALASLDRGFSAAPEAAERVEALARRLEGLAPPVVLSKQRLDGEATSSMQVWRAWDCAFTGRPARWGGRPCGCGIGSAGVPAELALTDAA